MKNIKAKKSLGQNFLKSKKFLEKIIEISDIKSGKKILEIGPGKGALTQKILEKKAKIFAIEKDRRMIDFLAEKFQEEIGEKKIKFFSEDALEIDYKKIGLKNGEFDILANLPYYITGKFLSNTFSNKILPKNLVLVIQKEVAERIVGDKNKKKQKESLLSLSIKVYGNPKYICSIGAKNFSPVPKVDSALIKISEISKDFFAKNKIDEKDFFFFLKASFSGKRKKMIKNLCEKKIGEKKKWEEIFSDLKISKDVRAEDLEKADFKNIFLEFFKK